jgi:hypothetical protein
MTVIILHFAQTSRDPPAVAADDTAMHDDPIAAIDEALDRFDARLRPEALAAALAYVATRSDEFLARELGIELEPGERAAWLGLSARLRRAERSQEA